MYTNSTVAAPTSCPPACAHELPTETPAPRGMWYESRASTEKPFLARWRGPTGAKEAQAFKTAEERAKFARQWAKRRADYGRQAPTAHPREIELLAELRRITGGADLLTVARDWMASRGVAEGRILVADAVARYREAIKDRPASPDSVYQRNLQLDRLVAHFGAGATLADLTPERIVDWIDNLAPPRAGGVAAPRTKRAHRGTLARLLDYAGAMGWLTRSPMAAVPVPVPEDDDVSILTVDQARRLFEAAAGMRCVGRLALEAFGGLRFSSAQRIEREDLRDDERGITFPAAKHKTGKRHYAEGFPANLWAWVAAAPEACWSLHPRVYADQKRAAFEAAGLKGGDNDDEDLRNCLRHSFATYHLAANREATKTAYLLTHANPSMLYRHYAGRATKAEGEAYFAIVPH